MIKESDIQKSIRDYIFLIGGYAVKVQSGGAYSKYGNYISLAEAGTPDVLAAIKERFVAIEVKTPRGVLSNDQIFRLRLIHKRNIDWIIATSVDDIKEYEKDNRYHGPAKFVDEVLNEDKKFVYTPTKGKKLSMEDLLRNNKWAEKKSSSISPF